MMHEIFAHLKGSNISGISKNCIGATATFRISIYAVNLKRLYCDFYPDAVLDLSHCPKLEVLSVQTFAGSSLSKIRLRKEAPLDMQFKIRNEDGEDCRHLIEIEYVQ